MKITFDPQEYIRGIQNILVSDKKRISFLFGAGTSFGYVPLISEMTKKIVVSIGERNTRHKTIFKKIETRIKTNTKQIYNIETILSQIEQIIEFTDNKSGFDGALKKEYEELRSEIKKQIVELVSAHIKIEEDKKVEGLAHSIFADWIGEANRKYPIEIFTTNYDYLIELGLENKDIPYYDGFKGSFNPFFYSNSIEDMNCYNSDAKLWKIHGSLGWKFDEENNKIIRARHEDNDILIFPSIQKYQESKKQPYISFLDRLYNFLKLDDTILITCGYSFNDEHINERIYSALKSNTSAHVVALYYDEIISKEKGKTNKQYYLKEGDSLYNLAMKQNKLSAYGMRNAVIGCKYGKWKLNSEPDNDEIIKLNYYYDEDSYDGEEDLKVTKKGTEKPSGEGIFKLPNFNEFVKFLKSMVLENEIFKHSEYIKGRE